DVHDRLRRLAFAASMPTCKTRPDAEIAAPGGHFADTRPRSRCARWSGRPHGGIHPTAVVKQVTMKIPRKVKIGLVILGVLGLVALWQFASYEFKSGYSKGSRTGIVRKVSTKGPPYCKYLEGELALQGGVPGVAQEIFRFTVDDHSDNNPIVQALKK